MKKWALFAICFAVIFFSKLAFCYDINDAIGDKIGGPAFELYGMDVTRSGNALTFDIYTNYPESGRSVVSGPFTWNTFPADLGIDADGDSFYEYGIAFTDHDAVTKGSLYRVTEWNTSNSYDPSGGHGFNYNKDQIVTIKDGSLLKGGAVNWNTIGSRPSYMIDVPLQVNKGGDFNIFYGGATCANDYVGGSIHVNPAPEPVSSTLFLLGSAALITRQYRKSRKEKSKKC